MVIIDIEVYKNYFLLSCLHVPTGKIKHFESLNDSPIDEQAIKTLMRRNTTVSFNGFAYDLPLLSYKLKGATNQQVKSASDKVIKSKLPSWRTFKDLRIDTPKVWDHIDLIEVAPGQSSLKIYGGRLGCKRLQDLPIDPSETISAEQADLLREYCENDLLTTQALYNALEQQVALRVSMSDQYGMDLRSKSDAQIAETIIKSELKRLTGKDHWRPELADDYTFRYQDPQIISFKTEQMRAVFARLLETDFGLGANGAVQMPDWLKEQRIKLGSTEYQMGVGGLHSCEKSRSVFRREGEILADFDVASYYPSIILQQKLAPQSLGEPFLKIYQSIVGQRLESKKKVSELTEKIKCLKNKLAGVSE